MTTTDTKTVSAHRRQRVAGALLGSAVGDALGAPFEFGPSGAFSARFPAPVHAPPAEMTGGKGWRPGEWTDDTQMSLLIAASLLERGDFDGADLFGRFQAWVAAGPADVGIQTRAVLTSGRSWSEAAAAYVKTGRPAAGNGSLMRTTPAAIFFSRQPLDANLDAARQISALTHGDPAAGDGCAIYHRLVAEALDGRDPLDAVDDAVAEVPHDRRKRWAAVLEPDWTPADATESNGAVWPTLGTAVWALRSTRRFADAMRLVIDLGGDTDTVAAVTGGLLGAVLGVQAIPSRWTTVVNGAVPGQDPALASDLASLMTVASRLDGDHTEQTEPTSGDGVEPVEVLPGLWLSDLDGAVRAPAGAVVISLCRTYGRITSADRRQVYLTDDARNLDVDAVLDDVLDTISAAQAARRPVLVHCFGGASRTGLVLRGWLMRSESIGVEEATERAGGLWPHLGLWEPTFDAALHRLADRLDTGSG